MNICASRSVARNVVAVGGIGFVLGTVFPIKVTALTGGMVFGSLFATQMITNRIAAHAETKYQLTPAKVRKLEIALSIVATTALLVSFVAFGVLTGGQALGVFLLIELFQLIKYFHCFDRSYDITEDLHAQTSQTPTDEEDTQEHTQDGPQPNLFHHIKLISLEEAAENQRKIRTYLEEQAKANKIKQAEVEEIRGNSKKN